MDMRWIWAGVATLGLGACDEVTVVDELSYAELAAENAAMVRRVTDLPVTAAADLPVTGSATYEGYAALDMQTERATAMVGEVEITADFDDATLSGTMDEFQGRVNGSAEQELEGELTLSDGDIGIGTPSGFTVEVEGELEANNGDVLAVDGTVLGSFRGEDGPDALLAVAVGGTDFTLNGTESEGDLAIVAEER
jgi:hypothetical protein